MPVVFSMSVVDHEIQGMYLKLKYNSWLNSEQTENVSIMCLFVHWWGVPENPSITEAGETSCSYQYEPKKNGPVIALIKQKPVHITVCHKYQSDKSLNSYHEMRLCIMFLLAVILSCCYSIMFESCVKMGYTLTQCVWMWDTFVKSGCVRKGDSGVNFRMWDLRFS
jgi:hypothetical protein